MAPTDLWARPSQRSIPIWLPIAAAALLLGRLFAPAPSAAQDEETLVSWNHLQSADIVARTQHKLILYDFSAAWCGPCHQLDRVVFEDVESARRINARFVAVRVVDRLQEEGANSKEVEALQRQYAVSAFPTLVVADADGHQRGKMVGFSDKKSVDDFLAGSLIAPAAQPGGGPAVR
jgi:thiol:disulfide interchange protein